jgi:hypothetical protein
MATTLSGVLCTPIFFSGSMRQEDSLIPGHRGRPALVDVSNRLPIAYFPAIVKNPQCCTPPLT